MARSITPKRYFSPDPRYGSLKVTKLIHYIMRNGKKNLAMRIVYESFETIQKKVDRNPIEVLEEASVQIKPRVEVRAKRVGGTNLQIPIEVRPDRQEQLWLRWLIQAAKGRSEKRMTDRLAYELIAASKGEGSAVKRKKGIHKAAESHKAYSHLR